MKRFAYLASTLAALTVAAGLSTRIHAEQSAPQGAPAEAPKAVVEGEMVDVKCHAAMGMGGGGKHAKCAMDCAKMGIPAGVVDQKTGQTYTVLAPAPGLAVYMGKTVRITGDLAEKTTAILPEKLEVLQEGKWVEAELPAGMM